MEDLKQMIMMIEGSIVPAHVIVRVLSGLSNHDLRLGSISRGKMAVYEPGVMSAWESDKSEE